MKNETETEMVRHYASQVQTLADIIIGGKNVPAPFCEVQEGLINILRERDEARHALRVGGMLDIIDRAAHDRAAAIRERDAMRDWIMVAAPMLSVASRIVIDEAVERLGEIAGCRGVLELCPVDFIRAETNP